MKNAYLFFKSHNNNFDNNQQSILIDPSKTELILISKNIFKKTIINQIHESCNQWKDPSDRIK